MLPIAFAMSLPSAGLLVLGLGAVGLALHRRDGRARLHALLGIALAATAFQVFHVAEHALQVGYWLLNPTEAPWLTPWAAVGRDALAATVDGRAGSGSELLHLVGNGLFLAGLVALQAAARQRDMSPARLRNLRLAVVVQGVHVAEHVVLTATWFATGEALGVSTGFGLFEAGTTLGGAVRVWFHFAINLVATLYALRALRDTDARRLFTATAPDADEATLAA